MVNTETKKETNRLLELLVVVSTHKMDTIKSLGDQERDTTALKTCRRAKLLPLGKNDKQCYSLPITVPCYPARLIVTAWIEIILSIVKV